MSEEPLDRRILREVRARLKESRAAVDEYERLQAALRALDEGAAETPARARAPRRTSAPTRQRARRGANRERALRVVGDRPGLTVAELAAATGIAKNTVYSLTRVLTQQGEIERVQLPGDSIGFRLSDATSEESPAAGGGNDGAASEVLATPQRKRRSRRRPVQTTEADSAGEAAPDEGQASSEPAPAA
jgi:hypothetical protein